MQFGSVQHNTDAACQAGEASVNHVTLATPGMQRSKMQYVLLLL